MTAYRWLVQEDATYHINPAAPPSPSDTLSTNFHKSYMPVVAQGCVGLPLRPMGRPCARRRRSTRSRSTRRSTTTSRSCPTTPAPAPATRSAAPRSRPAPSTPDGHRDREQPADPDRPGQRHRVRGHHSDQRRPRPQRAASRGLPDHPRGRRRALRHLRRDDEPGRLRQPAEELPRLLRLPRPPPVGVILTCPDTPATTRASRAGAHQGPSPRQVRRHRRAARGLGQTGRRPRPSRARRSSTPG